VYQTHSQLYCTVLISLLCYFIFSMHSYSGGLLLAYMASLPFCRRSIDGPSLQVSSGTVSEHRALDRSS